MLLGYARVSTRDQNPNLQLDALKKAGVEELFYDQRSGAKVPRPELQRLLTTVRKGDVVVVWRLSRLCRTVRETLALANDLASRGVELKSLTEAIDTTTAMGRCMFAVCAAFSAMEREIILENTHAGLLAARARGRVGGRKFRLEVTDREMAVRLYELRSIPVRDICAQFKISSPTLRKYAAMAKEEAEKGAAA